MKKRYITIKATDDGQRLDKVIPTYLPDVSRGQARTFIADGSVYIDKKRVRKNSRKVFAGQTVIVTMASSERVESDESMAALNVDIILEDKWFVVVNKPSGVPADETQTGWRGTLIDLLNRTFNYKYLQTVHRLDMGTSGVMVLSKTPAATKDLNHQFRERLVTKRYTALVGGVIEAESDEIITELGRDPRDSRKFASVASGGRKAVTRFTVLKRFVNSTLITVTIETGRTHQIRVHMSEYGNPILGDPIYGGGKSSRLMLHASELRFRSPRTEEPLICQAELPWEFALETQVPPSDS